MKHTIACVFGTRPEFIKVAPVIKALRNSRKFKVIVVNTAQHRQLVDDLVEYFGINPDFDLNIMAPNQSLPSLTSKLMTSLDEVFSRSPIDAVLVQGDTTTAFVASLAAFYHKIPVGHIEAGLRTHQIYSPFPEEINRQFVSRIAHWHFAPTKKSVANLVAEGLGKAGIFETGNTVIDTLLEEKELTRQTKKTVLVTVHRRENFGEPIVEICNALRDLALAYNEYEFVFPVHPNPNVKDVVHEKLGKISNFKLVDPLPYPKFISLLKSSQIAISDSGGIQEEAPSLGIPLLVLRESTERPEALETPLVKLVGTDRVRIIETFKALADDQDIYKKVAVPNYVYGDGTASKKIVEILSRHFNA